MPFCHHPQQLYQTEDLFVASACHDMTPPPQHSRATSSYCCRDVLMCSVDITNPTKPSILTRPMEINTQHLLSYKSFENKPKIRRPPPTHMYRMTSTFIVFSKETLETNLFLSGFQRFPDPIGLAGNTRITQLAAKDAEAGVQSTCNKEAAPERVCT